MQFIFILNIATQNHLKNFVIYFIKKQKMNQCNDKINIVAYYFIDEKDLKYENGKVRLKRKYGKYKREIIKIKNEKN